MFFFFHDSHPASSYAWLYTYRYRPLTNFCVCQESSWLTRGWDSRKTLNVLNAHCCQPGLIVQAVLVMYRCIIWDGRGKPGLCRAFIYCFSSSIPAVFVTHGPQKRMNTVYIWLQLNVLPKSPVITLPYDLLLGTIKRSLKQEHFNSFCSCPK